MTNNTGIHIEKYFGSNNCPTHGPYRTYVRVGQSGNEMMTRKCPQCYPIKATETKG